jgi:hypothetical protein
LITLNGLRICGIQEPKFEGGATRDYADLNYQTYGWCGKLVIFEYIYIYIYIYDTYLTSNGKPEIVMQVRRKFGVVIGRVRHLDRPCVC